MLWAISRTAAADFAERRTEGLQAHLDYLRSQKNILVISGATTSDDGKQYVGSLLIVNVKTRAEAQAFYGRYFEAFPSLAGYIKKTKGKAIQAVAVEPTASPVLTQLRLFNGDGVCRLLEEDEDQAMFLLERLRPGEMLLLENVRFHAAEEKNDPAFAARLASYADVFVNDAFGAAHRAHATTEAIARKLPAYAGRTMQAELEALESALTSPARPVMAIVGGAKVSTKLDLLKNLVGKLDRLAIGGGMANTFLYAQGIDIGGSAVKGAPVDTKTGRLLAELTPPTFPNGIAIEAESPGASSPGSPAFGATVAVSGRTSSESPGSARAQGPKRVIVSW